jgi:hypothetical protein
MIKKILLFLLSLSLNYFFAQSNLPECSQIFYSISGSTLQSFNALNPGSPSVSPVVLPSSSYGLAIGPAFGFTAPNPTYWTISNDTLWYYNGTAFTKSGHKIGNTSVTGLGGSSNFIYALDATTGQVYSYNGSGNATLITTIPTYTNGGLAQDVAGDGSGNFYILDLQAPQTLSRYNASGSQVCTYSISGIPTGTVATQAFSIIDNTVAVQQGTIHFSGIISGAGVTFSVVTNALNAPEDFAACPVSNTFTSFITSNAGACLNQTLALTVSSSLSGLTYSWSGPGIVGSVTSQSILVNMPGVYTSTLQNSECIPKFSVSSFTVLSSPTLIISGAGNICSGQTATLSSSGALNYTWFPGNANGAVYNVSPGSTTIYTLTGMDANGCTATASAQLSVTPTPTLSLFVSNPLICSGNTSTLSVSGANTYSWSDAALNGSVAVVSPTSSTGYTITGMNGACSSSFATGITVFPKPVILLSAQQVALCSGESTTLTASQAHTYTWSPGNIISSTIALNSQSTSIYTVTGTNTITGCSGVKTATVFVTVTPSISAAASQPTLCVGKSVTLTASGYSSYTWMPGSASSPVIVVSPSINTVYTLSAANNSCSASQTLAISAYINPTITTIAPSPTLCSAVPYTFSASGAQSYTWNPGAVIGATATLYPQTNTDFTVVGTSVQGCTAVAIPLTTIYPTPTLTAASNVSSVCPNSTGYSLTASGANSYLWMPVGANTSSFWYYLVNVGNVIHTHTVTGTLGGCVSSAIVTVQILPTPTINLTASSNTVCSGGIITLSVNGASTYSWGTSSTTTISPVYPGHWTFPTSYIYSVNGYDSNGCQGTSNGISITVYSLPSSGFANSNPGNLCAGSSTVLIATTNLNNSTYNWQPGPGNGYSLTVSPPAPTVYSVVITNSFGCQSAMVQYTLNVVPMPTLVVSQSTTQICQGASASFSVSGASFYTWYPGGSNSVFFNVSPSSSAVYTVTGSNAICQDTETVMISVNNNPPVMVSALPTNICIGSTSTLTVNGANTYTWVNGIVNQQTLMVSPTTNSVYWVTGSNTLTGCTASAAVLVSVTPQPTIITSALPATVCAGSSATLSVTGANNYTWNPGNSLGSTYTLISMAGTVYSVTGKTGPCVSTVSVNLQVMPLPTIAINNNDQLSVCPGNTLVLIATGATNYTWSPGPVASTSIAVSPTLNSTYTVTGANTLCKQTKTLEVNVLNSPSISAIASRTQICLGENVKLYAIGANTYTWSTNSTGSVTNVAPTVNEIITVVGADSNNCYSKKYAIAISVSECIGLENRFNLNNTVYVFPNPSRDIFTLNINSLSDNCFVEIYNSLGELIVREKIISTTQMIDLSGKSSGVYFLLLMNNGKVFAQTKLIKSQ